MEEKNNEENSEKTDELIEDREEQKKLVHPYRKYQLYIILMFIIMIILSLILYNRSKRLKKYLSDKDISYKTLTKIEEQSKGIKQLIDLVDVNYKYLNKLDEVKNIDIIKDPNEIYFLSSLISERDIVTYRVCYKSREDGDSPEKFIENCSNFSPLIFLIQTTEGYRFGVYISQFLNYEVNSGKGGYIWDNQAFIFSFDTRKRYNIRQPDYAIYIQPNDFPWFGKKDIFIGKYFTKIPSSFCDYPEAFVRNNEDKGDYILNGGIKKFIIKEMEVLAPSIWNFEFP